MTASTPSRADAAPGLRRRLRRLTTVAVLTAASLVLFLFESIVPAPIPWARPGLANVMTVTALFLLGPGSALLLTVLRILLGSLLLGSFLSPAFFLSAGGGALALALMAAARRGATPPLGIVGVSVLGSVGHVAGQLLVLSLLFVGDAGLLRLLPYLILSATLLGAFTGLASHALVSYLESRGYGT